MKGWKRSFFNEDHLPLVLEPERQGMSLKEFLESIQENREEIRRDLLQYGGILFRGFPIDDAEIFGRVVDTIGTGKRINYIGGDSPRTKVKNTIYTSTEAPKGITISLHNEMSFQRDYPSHIYFYCDVEPKRGGETIIGDARKIYHSMSEKVRDRFEEKRVKYISRYYYKSWFMDFVNRIQRGHKTWIDVFETESREEVERQCESKEFGHRWLRNNWLEIFQVRPPTLSHAITKEKVWFNQIHLYDYNPRFLGMARYLGAKMFYCLPNTLVHETCYADDTKISRSDIYHIHDVLDKHTISFPWKKGDLMLLDNILAMHGRAAQWEGNRRILTAMTK